MEKKAIDSRDTTELATLEVDRQDLGVLSQDSVQNYGGGVDRRETEQDAHEHGRREAPRFERVHILLHNGQKIHDDVAENVQRLVVGRGDFRVQDAAGTVQVLRAKKKKYTLIQVDGSTLFCSFPYNTISTNIT
jgi:hypothetical protein